MTRTIEAPEAQKAYERAKSHLAEEMAWSACEALGYCRDDIDMLRDRSAYEKLCDALEELIP